MGTLLVSEEMNVTCGKIAYTVTMGGGFTVLMFRIVVLMICVSIIVCMHPAGAVDRL